MTFSLLVEPSCVVSVPPSFCLCMCVHGNMVIYAYMSASEQSIYHICWTLVCIYLLQHYCPSETTQITSKRCNIQD